MPPNWDHTQLYGGFEVQRVHGVCCSYCLVLFLIIRMRDTNVFLIKKELMLGGPDHVIWLLHHYGLLKSLRDFLNRDVKGVLV